MATAGVALLALVLSACAPGGAVPDGEATTPTTGLPDGVTVELQQGRSDVAARQAQVVVRNGTDETLVVGSVEVDDPRFAAPIVRLSRCTLNVPAMICRYCCESAPTSAPAPPPPPPPPPIEVAGLKSLPNGRMRRK